MTKLDISEFIKRHDIDAVTISIEPDAISIIGLNIVDATEFTIDTLPLTLNAIEEATALCTSFAQTIFEEICEHE